MLCTKSRYGFAQFTDCPAQRIDQYFAQQSMDMLHNPWIVRSVATLCKVYGSSEQGFVLC